MKITQDEFRLLASYIYNISGIHLEPGKVYLVETRLGPLVRQLGLASFSALYQKVKTDRSGDLEKKIIDAITTGETLFFRDKSPFELLKHKLIPELIDRRKAKTPQGQPIPIRIWSAACSTGQEIYSVAITLKELLGDLGKYNIKLVGTDISDSAIAKASYGLYNQFEVARGLSEQQMQRYFVPQPGNAWRIKDEIRAMALFKKHNLMDGAPGIGRFDIIFARNVAIYFNDEGKKKLCAKISQSLEPDGAMIIGATESLAGVCTRFESKRYLRYVFYQLKQAA